MDLLVDFLQGESEIPFSFVSRRSASKDFKPSVAGEVQFVFFMKLDLFPVIWNESIKMTKSFMMFCSFINAGHF